MNHADPRCDQGAPENLPDDSIHVRALGAPSSASSAFNDGGGILLANKQNNNGEMRAFSVRIRRVVRIAGRGEARSDFCRSTDAVVFRTMS